MCCMLKKIWEIHPQVPASGHGGGDDNLLLDFIECYRKGKKSLVDGEAGKWSVLVGWAAEKSVHEGIPVKI